METKEAIWYFKNYEDYNKHIFRENIDCILKALTRGEKFEEMWEEIGKEFKEIYGSEGLEKLIIDKLKRKYFPKSEEVNDGNKKAIEFLEKSKMNYISKGEYPDEIDNIIKLLQYSEKYRQIVEEVEQYIIDRRTIEEDFATNGAEILDLIKWLKRKYFPKEIEK